MLHLPALWKLAGRTRKSSQVYTLCGGSHRTWSTASIKAFRVCRALPEDQNSDPSTYISQAIKLLGICHTLLASSNAHMHIPLHLPHIIKNKFLIEKYFLKRKFKGKITFCVAKYLHVNKVLIWKCQKIEKYFRSGFFFCGKYGK